jgi:4'-phosphopantetheinyl transferase EntD
MKSNLRRGQVAMVDSANMSPTGFAAYLSPAELLQSEVIASPGRRAEWLAGRVAAKYAFLRREVFGPVVPGAGLQAAKVGVAELAEFDQAIYTSVVVTRDKSPGGGPARAGWESGSERVQVAISHIHGLACAFIGDTTGIYSVDLEACTHRVPEFYQHNFTPREQSWASSTARSFDVDSDWLYTLLWSAKECLLKTPVFSTMSLWNMPSLEINVLGGSERLKRLHDATSITGDFEFLRADIAPSAKHIQLAVAATTDLVLTAITNLD